MATGRVSYLERLRFVLAHLRRGRPLAERRQADEYVPPAHWIRRQHRELARFKRSWPWSWLPSSWIPYAFGLFGASDELLRAIEDDLRRWREAREGRRPYWTESARLAPREDDPETVRLLLERLRSVGDATERQGRQDDVGRDPEREVVG